MKNAGTAGSGSSGSSENQSGPRGSTTSEGKPDVDCVLDLSKPITLLDEAFAKPGLIDFDRVKPVLHPYDYLTPTNAFEDGRTLDENVKDLYKKGPPGEITNLQQYELPDGARMVIWDRGGATDAVVVTNNNDVWGRRDYGRLTDQHSFSNGSTGSFSQGSNEYRYTDLVGQTTVLQLRSPIRPGREH